MQGHATRMWALESPTFKVDSGLLVVGATGFTSIPMPSYLIEHPRGLVLFDTGIHPDAVSDPVAFFGADFAAAAELTPSEDLRLDSQIRKTGHELSDVTHVIASHMHFDHAGGLFLFPKAKFFAGAGERRYAYMPEGAGKGFYDRRDLVASEDFDWYDIPSTDVDFFNDGAIRVLFTPGHSPGELSLLVRLPSRTIILTGDTAHARESIDTGIPSPAAYDTVAASASLRKLRLWRETSGAEIWTGHDPRDWSDFVGANGAVFE